MKEFDIYIQMNLKHYNKIKFDSICIYLGKHLEGLCGDPESFSQRGPTLITFFFVVGF